MPDTDPVVEVVITADDEDWLITFTRSLVKQRLAAAAHHNQIRSIYTWDGQTYDRIETRAALHTRAALFDDIAAIVRAEHPYDLACAIALPIAAISPDYQRWVLDSTKEA